MFLAAPALAPLPPTLCETGLAFLPAKSVFCHLPVLTGLNRQKEEENGKNENVPLAHLTCCLKPVNISIRNTWCPQAKLTTDKPQTVAYHWILLSFSLASLLVQKDDNQPLTGNRTIFDRREAWNVLACWSTCQDWSKKKNKNAFDD